MISCMSFNVLGCETKGYEPRAVRGPHLHELILEHDTDLVGVQEANSGSKTFDFCDALAYPLCVTGPYACSQLRHQAGFQEKVGRQPNGAGLIIFYKKDRFELLAEGAHKYTSTERQVRYFQWVRLLDKESGKEIVMTNTHWSINWDEEGKVSAEAGDKHRTKQAHEILAFWKGNADDAVLFATGDYNCKEDSKWYKIAAADKFKGAQQVIVPAVESMRDVDQCFVNSETVTVERFEFIDAEIKEGDRTFRYSDHRPLIVEVTPK